MSIIIRNGFGNIVESNHSSLEAILNDHELRNQINAPEQFDLFVNGTKVLAGQVIPAGVTVDMVKQACSKA